MISALPRRQAARSATRTRWGRREAGSPSRLTTSLC
jgi:hypothetical protein